MRPRPNRPLRPAALLLTLALAAPAAAQTAPDPNLPRLEREMARLAEEAGGTMGVTATHVETGRTVRLNGGEAFPMASSYKVPIAVQLLTRVEAGEIRLDSMVMLEPTDLHPGSGTIAELLDDPGVALSARNLLELMLLISDNSATDLVLELAGGPAAVTARMRAAGYPGIRVDRPTIGLIGEWIGIGPVTRPMTMEQFDAAADAVSEARQEAAGRAFDADPQDTSTPDAMTALLTDLWRGELLSPQSRDLLFDIMTRSTTGRSRIRGMLPQGVEVAHKTGTIGGTTNDVGVITLPDGAGHVAISAFVKGSDQPVEARERAIAQVSRAVYDYFLFSPVPPGR